MLQALIIFISENLATQKKDVKQPVVVNGLSFTKFTQGSWHQK